MQWTTSWWSSRETLFRPKRRKAMRARAICGALAAVAGLLMAGGSTAAAAAARKVHPPAIPAEHVVPHTLAARGKAPVAQSYRRYSPLVDSRLPGAGSAVAAMPAAGSRVAPTNAPAAVSVVNPGAVRAGSLPVLVGPAVHSVPGGRTATAGAAPASVTVTMTNQPTALAAGVHGILFKIAPTAGASGAGAVQVSVDDSSFVAAYGGDYAARLHLVEMPACALTTPHQPACQTQTPLAPVGGSSLTARVTLPTAGAAAGRVGLAVARGAISVPGTAVILAATSGSGGSSGTYAASSLSPAGTWSEGTNTGAFDYSYPIQVPTAIGGATPALLAYDSSAEDASPRAPTSVLLGRRRLGHQYRELHRAELRVVLGRLLNRRAAVRRRRVLGRPDSDAVAVRASTQIVYDDRPIRSTWCDLGHQDRDLMTCDNGTYNGEYFGRSPRTGSSTYFGLNQLPGLGGGGHDDAVGLDSAGVLREPERDMQFLDVRELFGGRGVAVEPGLCGRPARLTRGPTTTPPSRTTTART